MGGYGRRELCPSSDLDVVLVHNGRRDVARVAERIWYPIWDAGVPLDHSVRTVREALAVAGSDLKAALGLLDARPVAGDRALGEELRRRALEQWRAKARRSLPALDDAIRRRHEEWGEVAFLLEPDLKEARGGLRDMAALRAASLASSVVRFDPDALREERELLLSVRVELHRRAGRAVDRLLLQEQDGVAEALGFADADALMRAVARAARTVAWTCDDAWRRVRSALAGPRGRQAAGERLLGPGLREVDDELALAPEADPAADPALVLRAAAVAARRGLPFSRAALARLEAEVRPPGEPWPDAARAALVSLLGAGPDAIPVIETLDQHDLLVRLLPEWEAVRSKPQRNAYHRFTVDRHLVETAAAAAGLARDVGRPDLLLVAALLHDIGKGHPGDHVESGQALVGHMAARMGFCTRDVGVLVRLVRHHLLLADTATRRDLDDPATIECVAAAVGDEETLDLLAALTVADSCATGPAAWGDWKAGLVADLVERTRRHLAGAGGEAPPSLPAPEHLERMSAGDLSVEVSGTHVTVVAADRPGLFSRVAGALALLGLDVRRASAASDDRGMAVEVFEVEPTAGRDLVPARVESLVERAVTGRLALDARLAERARTYSRRRRAAVPARPRVLFDNDASAVATVVEVRTADGVGVLYRITRALADADLDIRSAKVATLGHEVVDAFYVRDAAGGKVADREHLDEIERAILAALVRDGA